ncbi:hypothetical protein PIB30_043435 [Stylosanthes scabra]|uniref:Chromo domain-containing protein n=1 Tax=Stylosanthes scabra TaxID=79078 RepID=A0ABU6UE75_9FABA|nr:hypothetical protein [Stylosanthes scabra]
MEIFDVVSRNFAKKEILLVKVRWNHGGVEDDTWEKESEMKEHHPLLFLGKVSVTKESIRGVSNRLAEPKHFKIFKIHHQRADSVRLRTDSFLDRIQEGRGLLLNRFALPSSRFSEKRTIGSSKCLWGLCFHVGQRLTSRLTVATRGPPANVSATNLDIRVKLGALVPYWEPHEFVVLTPLLLKYFRCRWRLAVQFAWVLSWFPSRIEFVNTLSSTGSDLSCVVEARGVTVNLIGLGIKHLMSRRGKQVATDAATPSRLHFDRWKGLENRDIVHERIVRIDGEEEPIFRNRIQGLGWGFMYKDLVRINVSVVREFCANFSSAKQGHVFLRGKKIPFTETNIHHHLGIHGDAPDAGVDDAFVTPAKSYEVGEDMNMAAIYAEIGRKETNWADNLVVNIIPKTINNSILNPLILTARP